MTENLDNPWRTVGTRVVYRNPWIAVREDRVVRPDGRPGIYGVVEMRPSIGVVALNVRGEVALVEQWRYVHDKMSTEIPTGGSLADEADIEAAARRELREETGLTAASWRFLGAVDNSNGVTDDIAHIFLATGLHQGHDDQEGTESIRLVWRDFDQVVGMVLEGKITESVTVAAVLKVEVMRTRGKIDY